MKTTNNKIEAKLYKRTIEFENKYGLASIVKKFDSLYSEGSHIADYRNFIRKHADEWSYNDKIANDYNSFNSRFVSTSLNYVQNAVKLFEFILTDNLKCVEALQLAYFSESERGREGKTSKIGLDNFQDRLINSLEKSLINNGVDKQIDLDESVNIICQTMLSSHSSAFELKTLYIQYIENYNIELSLKNHEQVNYLSNGLAHKILREYCCYSILKFNNQLNQYRTKLNNNISKAQELRQKKLKIVEHISALLLRQGIDNNEFLKLVSQIDTLNFYNDNIDVKYALKSWPGLIHWKILEQVKNENSIHQYSKTL